MNKYTKLTEPANLAIARRKELTDITTELLINPSLTNFKFKAYSTNGVKDILKLENHNKCCYCGCFLKDSQNYSEIEHYRPKKDNPQNNEFNARGLGYYWLAAEWDNLFLSCKICNNKKGNKFPLINPKDRSISSKDITSEKPCLLNYTEHDYVADEHFKFEEGEIKGLGQRAIKTIKICELFRDDLTRERKSRALSLKKECVEFFEQINGVNDKLTFSTLKYRCRDLKSSKDFFEKYLKQFPNDSHEFSTLESQILNKEILINGLTIDDFKDILENEENTIINFKIDNAID